MSEAAQLTRASRQLHVALGLLVWRTREPATADDLTLSELSVVARLGAMGQATAAELARAEGITPQSMSTTINALVSRRLVRRKPDADDGRRRVLSLTPAGRNVLDDEGRDRRAERLSEVLEQEFTARERTALAKAAPLLARLAREL